MADVIKTSTTVVGTTIGTIMFIMGFGLLLAFPIKWTWNYTMPYLFNLGTISWGQAWCLHFVCNHLIKSLHIH